jgi:hypothetical protein
MRVADRIGEISHQSGRFVKRQEAPFEHVLQRHSVDIVRYKNELILDLDNLMHTDDARVTKPGCRASLAAESLAQARIIEYFWVWNLERDQPVKLGIARPPDGAKAATAQAFEQLEPAQRAGPGQSCCYSVWNNHAKRTFAVLTMHKAVRLRRARDGTVAVGAASVGIPFQSGCSAHTFSPTTPTAGIRESAPCRLLFI